MHIHSIIPRALRKRATHNIDMAVEPEEGGKLAHGGLQSTLPVRAKTRRQTITSDGTPGLLCLSNPGRRQTAIFLLQKLPTGNFPVNSRYLSGRNFLGTSRELPIAVFDDGKFPLHFVKML